MSFYKVFLSYILPIILGYLFGSISFGIILSQKKFNQDIRNYGSKSSGMTNTMRVYGVKYAVPVFAGDFLKGVVPVLVMRYISIKFLGGDMIPFYLAGVFAVIGHLFPLFFNFRGGKGVSTTFGATIAIQPLVAVVCFAVFLLVAFSTKIISLGSIIAAVSIPLISFVLCILSDRNYFIPTVFSFIFAIIIVVMHRTNIKRLIKGEEKRIKLK